jgi:transposase
MGKARQIVLSESERETLVRWVRGAKTERRLVERARIILSAADGKNTKDIASEEGIWPARVSKWRVRFVRWGLSGLSDMPRSGNPARYDDATEKRILRVLDKVPPSGYSGWTGSLISRHLGDVSEAHVWRVLRRHGISLQRRRSWCISTDPEFGSKAADIVGLYLDPPENILVLSVDEKPSIQALERAQGWLRLPNGKALTGYNHEYTRHGTTTLFAALETATGLVKTGHFQRRRRKEFLAFMNDLVADYPDREIHVILDNLSTHKPKRDGWLSHHKNIFFHYTPTHASWLNQIEIWFGILTRQALRNASFTSPRQLREAIDRFVEAYNQQAAPFEWKKQQVFPKTLKPHDADLCR